MQVLIHLDMREIPKRNIMERWTKLYDDDMGNSQYLQNLAITNTMQKKSLVLKKAFEFANKDGKLSNRNFNEAIRVLEKANKVEMANKGPTNIEIGESNNQDGGKPTSCPVSTSKGGRPPHTSLKSWQASKKKKKERKQDSSVDKEITDWPDEESPPLKKQRSIADITKNYKRAGSLRT